MKRFLILAAVLLALAALPRPVHAQTPRRTGLGPIARHGSYTPAQWGFRRGYRIGYFQGFGDGIGFGLGYGGFAPNPFFWGGNFGLPYGGGNINIRGPYGNQLDIGWGGGWNSRYAGGYGWYDTTRPMAFGGFAATPRSSSNVGLFSLGARAAYVVENNDGTGRPYGQIWVITLADGKSIRLGGEKEPSFDPVWSADGTKLLVMTGHSVLIRKPAGASR